MPVHRAPVDDVERVVDDIERTEDIVSVATVGDGAVLVFTKRRRATRETR